MNHYRLNKKRVLLVLPLLVIVWLIGWFLYIIGDPDQKQQVKKSAEQMQIKLLILSTDNKIKVK